MDRAQKTELVGTLQQQFGESSLIVVTHYTGMTVAEMTDLRRRMNGAGASFRVTKNRLTRLALAGTKFEGLSSLFIGPTAIAFSTDPVAAAKVAVEYSKSNSKLVILGGALGTDMLDVEGINALATLPSLDELRGRLLGMIQTPASRIAAVLQAPAGQVARALAAHAEAEGASQAA